MDSLPEPEYRQHRGPTPAEQAGVSPEEMREIMHRLGAGACDMTEEEVVLDVTGKPLAGPVEGNLDD